MPGPSPAALPIPAHERRFTPWRQSFRGGTREDRTMREVEVSLPPRLADLDLATPSALGAEMDAALRAISRLDDTHGEHLAPLATMLLRAESVASSKIERVEASTDDYARALHGMKANASAMSMVASTRALADLIDSVGPNTDAHPPGTAGSCTGTGRALTLGAILSAHRILMADDPEERAYAGRLRDMQNWIGGSDHSPRGALYVPPPPETVPAHLDDLIAYAGRTDVPVLTQAALTHAQFESIHPFTDGNGRIGRALINTILRRRGITSRVVVPLASALVARRDDYFDALGAYRAGDAAPIIRAFTHASTLAAEESATTATRLAELPDTWLDAARRPRNGSAARRILDTLLETPVFTTDEIATTVGGPPSSVYAAIDRLHTSVVVRPLTQRTRNQVWGAAALLDELDDLGVRIDARARTERG
ncbi:Fic family protein [Nocardioides sp. GY 10127]|nr:Fic family protein [Nocardioides sp. GY 10127]